MSEMNEANQHRLKGNAHFEQGEFAHAIDCYDQSLAAKETAAAFSNRAQANIQLKKFDLFLFENIK
jgi:tetratricopeptide (TPR) repeat protein